MSWETRASCQDRVSSLGRGGQGGGLRARGGRPRLGNLKRFYERGEGGRSPALPTLDSRGWGGEGDMGRKGEKDVNSSTFPVKLLFDKLAVKLCWTKSLYGKIVAKLLSIFFV